MRNERRNSILQRYLADDQFSQSLSNRQAEIDEAGKIVYAFEAARDVGKGAVEVDGKMVDAPVYNRAIKVLHTLKPDAP